MEEIKHNPLVGFTVQFQDGCQLGLRMDHPVPQVKAMLALGHFAYQLGMKSVDFTLPRQPQELVEEAIHQFFVAQKIKLQFDLNVPQDGVISSDEKYEAFTRDMAKAVLDAVMTPELVSELFDASQAQHEGLDLLFARLIALDKDFYPSKSGLPWEAMLKGNAAREMAKPILEGG